jgi:putative sporulation protein YyaC
VGFFSVLTPPQKIKAHIDQFPEMIRAESQLRNFFADAFPRPILILCIGTDRSTGDSLGPFVGMQLTRRKLSQLQVWGTLDQPVHAANMTVKLTQIKQAPDHPYIFAIDACLGNRDSIGCITLASGPLKPGAGVHKDLPAVGDSHLTGIVNVGGFMEYLVLQNTRLNLVWRMSETITSMIARAYITSLAPHQRYK